MRCKTRGEKCFLSVHRSKLGNIHNNNIFKCYTVFHICLLETVHLKPAFRTKMAEGVKYFLIRFFLANDTFKHLQHTASCVTVYGDKLSSTEILIEIIEFKEYYL